MKKILVLFSLLLIATVNAQDLSQKINLINSQKVLTQEILKEYSFKGMGNNFANSKENLSNKLKEYAKVNQTLVTLLVDSQSKKQIKLLNQTWLSIVGIFEAKPSKSEVLKLQKNTDKILGMLSDLMKIVLGKNKAQRDNIINISSYQAVIIERMSALYMMKTWGIDDPKFNFKMRESVTFFNNSLNKLLDSPKTDEENRKMIKEIMRYFKFFEIMNASKSKFIPTLIYAKTDKIHQKLNIISQRYLTQGK